MSRGLRVIVVNTDEEVARDLRTVLLSIEGVRIVAEIDEPAMLAHALQQFAADILLIHLDPNPNGMMDVVAPLIEAHKEQFAAIAMTEDRDAELVMRAMRSGMREFLWKPFPPDQIREILERVGKELAPDRRQLGRMITVVGAAGGVGATQVVTNVAAELAQLVECDDEAEEAVVRRRVAVVDLDFRFGQVAMHFDANPTYTIAELCDSPEQIDAQMIDRAMFKHPSGAHILARPSELAQAEQISAGQCAGALAALQEHYDFVVVDLPARLDATARAAYDTADAYLLVAQLAVPTVRSTDRILRELARNGYSGDRIRLVCNRYERDAGSLDLSDVESTLNRKFDFLLPDDWKTSAAAVNMGAPLFDHAPKSKLRDAYRRIALALAGENAATNSTAAGDKKGLLSFLGAR